MHWTEGRASCFRARRRRRFGRCFAMHTHVRRSLVAMVDWLSVGSYFNRWEKIQTRATPTDKRIERTTCIAGRIRTVRIDARGEKGSSALPERMANPSLDLVLIFRFGWTESRRGSGSGRLAAVGWTNRLAGETSRDRLAPADPRPSDHVAPTCQLASDPAGGFPLAPVRGSLGLRPAGTFSTSGRAPFAPLPRQRSSRPCHVGSKSVRPACCSHHVTRTCDGDGPPTRLPMRCDVT